MTMNFTTQGTDFSGADQAPQAPQSAPEATPVVSESSATYSQSDYDQEFQSKQEPQPQSQVPANQTNVRPEQKDLQNTNPQGSTVNDDDAFEKYYDIQNPNFSNFAQQPNQDFQQQQSFQQPNQNFQPQVQQPQVQQNLQPQGEQELYNDFSQIVEQAKSIESFDLGLSEEQVIDMLDKDPVGFANNIVKVAVQQALGMVQKFDIGSVIEQNSLDTFSKHAEQERVTRNGQAFMNQSMQELQKQGIMLNDTQSSLVFSTLAQNFLPSYQMYAQDFGNAYRAGTLNVSHLPHSNGQMLTEHEYAMKSVVKMAKEISRGQQQQAPKPYQKVTNNQIYQQSNSAPVGQKSTDDMTSEEFQAHRKH